MAAADIRTAIPKQVIKYLKKNMGYLEAREYVKDRGGLPPNLLHDNTLLRSDDWKELRSERCYGAWAREFYVYPARNGKFERGMDVVDADLDIKGRGWVLPAGKIPDEAFEVEMPSLFVDPGIDPKRIEVTDKKVVIAHPFYTKVIHPSIQVNGQAGKMDEATGIPTYMDEALRNQLPPAEKRRLGRIAGAGVRPIARLYGHADHTKRNVYADRKPDEHLGVGHVISSFAPVQAAGELPGWLAVLLKEAAAAEESISMLEGRVSKKELEDMRRLVRGVRALGIRK